MKDCNGRGSLARFRGVNVNPRLQASAAVLQINPSAACIFLQRYTHIYLHVLFQTTSGRLVAYVVEVLFPSPARLKRAHAETSIGKRLTWAGMLD